MKREINFLKQKIIDPKIDNNLKKVCCFLFYCSKSPLKPRNGSPTKTEDAKEKHNLVAKTKKGGRQVIESDDDEEDETPMETSVSNISDSGKEEENKAVSIMFSPKTAVNSIWPSKNCGWLKVILFSLGKLKQECYVYLSNWLALMIECVLVMGISAQF